MTVINTNTASINAQFNLNKVNKQMEAAMEQLSSGKRINTASDDAAGMAISSRITSEVKGIEMAIRNASDGQALIDTAEGAHVEIENMLQRARELAVQASNDTNSADDRASLQLEIDQLLTEIDRTAANTSWAGKTLMGGASGGTSEFSFQVGTGNAAADRVSISIAEMSSSALGIGSTAAASGGRAVGPAGVSYADGTLTVVGVPKAGDTFTFDLNGTAVSTTFSEVDQYPDNAAGAAAQIKAAVDVLVAANPTTLGNVSVKNNDNGTLSFSQGTSATIDTFSHASNTASIDEANGTITFDGTYATGAYAVNINGTTVTYTAAASDGFMASNIGAATGLKQQIENTAGLENIVVTDHADGSLTIKQLDAPFIEALEVTPTTVADVGISYADATGVITVSGAWTEGQEISMDILGETVSFTVKDDDAYGNTLAGISSQLAAAINDAGISGLTAAKDANANTVTLADTMIVTDATVDSGSSFITHTIGGAGTSEIALSGTDVVVGSATADTPATGDAYTFSVNGHELKLVVGTDGYSDDLAGVSQQMKDLIDGLNIEGLTVTANTATHSGVTMARVLTGTGTVGSTVVTNITSLGADEIGDPSFSGEIDVSSAAASADAIDRIDAALLAINTQRAELGAVSNRMDYTINNLSNVSSNLQSGLSRIQDADFAKVTGDLTKSQIMSQAATAMLAQANASKQGVLSLLQG
ncbi:flagellin [Planktomarina temperata]|nr:flagellin [Planktomarina temperata]